MKRRMVVAALMLTAVCVGCDPGGSDGDPNAADTRTDTATTTADTNSPVDTGSPTDTGVDVRDTSRSELDTRGSTDATDGETTDDADATRDSGKERISTDADKVECATRPCSGTKRCYRPGQGDQICETCSFGPDCPDKCIRRCLKRCFTDGTCDNSDETCVDGNAEGARVCLPDDS